MTQPRQHTTALNPAAAVRRVARWAGVFVLPAATITELHHLVYRALRASGPDERVHRQLAARLRMLRIACVGRTDTLT